MFLSRGSIPNKVLSGIGSNALAFVAYNVFYAIGEEGIDMAAHVGGLATGFLCGATMRLPLSSGSVKRRWVRNGIVGEIGAAVIAFAISKELGHAADVRGAILHFGEVEERVFAKFNDTIQKAQAGELSEAQVSLILDQEILSPWREAREAFEQMEDVPAQQKHVVNQLLTYISLRQEALEVLLHAVEAGDGDEKWGNLFAEKMQEADQIIADLEEAE